MKEAMKKAIEDAIDDIILQAHEYTPNHPPEAWKHAARLMRAAPDLLTACESVGLAGFRITYLIMFAECADLR